MSGFSLSRNGERKENYGGDWVTKHSTYLYRGQTEIIRVLAVPKQDLWRKYARWSNRYDNCVRFCTAHLLDCEAYDLGCRRSVIKSMFSNYESRLCVKAYCVEKDIEPSSKESHGGNTSWNKVYTYLQSVKGDFGAWLTELRFLPPPGNTKRLPSSTDTRTPLLPQSTC